ncbi:hypothetical protein Dimus_012285 [Dionaea muscipula]
MAEGSRAVSTGPAVGVGVPGVHDVAGAGRARGGQEGAGSASPSVVRVCIINESCDMAIPFTIHRLVIKKDAGYGFDSAIVAASSSYAADTTSAFGTRFWNKNLSISIDHLHLHTRRPSLNLPHSSTISDSSNPNSLWHRCYSADGSRQEHRSMIAICRKFL